MASSYITVDLEDGYLNIEAHGVSRQKDQQRHGQRQATESSLYDRKFHLLMAFNKIAMLQKFLGGV